VLGYARLISCGTAASACGGEVPQLLGLGGVKAEVGLRGTRGASFKLHIAHAGYSTSAKNQSGVQITHVRDQGACTTVSPDDGMIATLRRDSG